MSPVGNASGENMSTTRADQYIRSNIRTSRDHEQGILLFGRASGLISPSRTTFSACSRAAKLKKRERLILPMGRRSALSRTGAIGDRGSTPMLSVESD